MYLTLNIDPDRSKAEAETERYAEGYYGIPLEVMRRVQDYYIGDAAEAVGWLAGYVDAGARHLVLRFATVDPMPQVERAAAEMLAGLRELGV